MAESAFTIGDDRIISHLQFARAVASRSIDPRCGGADREDLIAWGVVGLVQANRKLQPLRHDGPPGLRCYIGLTSWK